MPVISERMIQDKMGRRNMKVARGKNAEFGSLWAKNWQQWLGWHFCYWFVFLFSHFGPCSLVFLFLPTTYIVSWEDYGEMRIPAPEGSGQRKMAPTLNSKNSYQTLRIALVNKMEIDCDGSYSESLSKISPVWWRPLKFTVLRLNVKEKSKFSFSPNLFSLHRARCIHTQASDIFRRLYARY